jgi:hypothetical protein
MTEGEGQVAEPTAEAEQILCFHISSVNPSPPPRR